jgi:hypothetical protein
LGVWWPFKHPTQEGTFFLKTFLSDDFFSGRRFLECGCLKAKKLRASAPSRELFSF